MMAFNLIGQDPIATVGKEFRVSLFIWHPLWEYVEDQYPEIASKVVDAHFNAGGSLDKQDSLTLAESLDNDFDSGLIAEYVKKFQDFIDNLPETDCYQCFGIGKHRVSILKALREPCRACNGTGKAKHFVTQYTLYPHDFVTFALFLRNCGGFVIS